MLPKNGKQIYLNKCADTKNKADILNEVKNASFLLCIIVGQLRNAIYFRVIV